MSLYRIGRSVAFERLHNESFLSLFFSYFLILLLVLSFLSLFWGQER